MSQVLLVLLFFCFYCTEAATIQWTGTHDNNWWNPLNWACDHEVCLPTSQDDVIVSPIQCNTSCNQQVVIGNPQADCRSLLIQSDSSFQFTLEILSGLVVGIGGVNVDHDSALIVFGKLYSAGDVLAKGNFFVQSGEIYGPGKYSFYKLLASTCFLNAHVMVTTDLIVGPQAPGLADAILIQSNASLNVSGNLITDSPITISGIISVNSSVIFTSRNNTYKYVLTGNLPQSFGSITITAGVLMATTPIVTRSLYVGAGATVQLFYDSSIGNAKGSGLISVLNGNVGIDVNDSSLKIISTGNLVITGNSVDEVTVTGGDFTTNLMGGSVFNINNLTVVRGYLHLANVSVKQVFLGDGVVIAQGSLNVTNVAISTGALTIFQSRLVIEKGATFQQLNGNFQLFGESSEITPVFVNDGLYILKGDLKTYVFTSGNGVWNMEGSWFIGFECNISGTINLIGNTTLTLDNQFFNYELGTVRNGGFLGKGGYFTAQQLSVDWIDDQFAQSFVENITVVNNYSTHCCGQRKIDELRTKVLDLEPGNYPFTVGKGIIDLVSLKDGVSLRFEQLATIANLEFTGGSLSTNGSLVVTVQNTTYLSTDSLKVIIGNTILQTGILDCTKCSNPTCNLQGWNKIKASTTRGRCALQSDYFYLIDK